MYLLLYLLTYILLFKIFRFIVRCASFIHLILHHILFQQIHNFVAEAKLNWIKNIRTQWHENESGWNVVVVYVQRCSINITRSMMRPIWRHGQPHNAFCVNLLLLLLQFKDELNVFASLEAGMEWMMMKWDTREHTHIHSKYYVARIAILWLIRFSSQLACVRVLVHRKHVYAKSIRILCLINANIVRCWRYQVETDVKWWMLNAHEIWIECVQCVHTSCRETGDTYHTIHSQWNHVNFVIVSVLSKFRVFFSFDRNFIWFELSHNDRQMVYVGIALGFVPVFEYYIYIYT